MTLSLFTSQTPSVADASDGAPGLTLGTAIYSTVPGYITGIRWFFPATLPAATVIGLLYEVTTSTTGTELAREDFVSPSAGTWNTVLFDTPVAIDADTLYCAAVWTPDRYVATGSFFGADLVNDTLVGIEDATNPTGLPGNVRNGKFHVGASPAFPEDFSSASNYFADVLFESSLSNDAVFAATLPALAAALAGNQQDDGTLAGTLPALTATFGGDQLDDATVAAVLPALTASLAGDQRDDGAFAATLPALTATLAGDQLDDGALPGVLPVFTTTLAGDQLADGMAAATLPALLAAFTGGGAQIDGALAATFPAMVAALRDDPPIVPARRLRAATPTGPTLRPTAPATATLHAHASP